MVYADYNYYRTEYMGHVIAEVDFPRLALRASEYIDAYTWGNVAKLDVVPTEVKKAVCAIAEKLCNYNSSSTTAKVTSESVGSYSVTYDTTSSKTLEQDIGLSLKLYLGNTGLLYRGL